MFRALALTILALGVVFLFLALLIVANKAWRETREAWRRRRRDTLEPKVLDYAHSEESTLLAHLGGSVRRRDRRVLEQVLMDHVHRVRGIERERLTRAVEQLGFVDEYLADLRSRRWWRRAEAAEHLGLSGARRAVGPLVERLEDEVPEVRLRAAKALGVLGGVSAIRPLIRALSEPNRWSTIRIADILAGAGHEVVDELVSAFPDMNVHARVAALDILAKIRPLQIASWLPARLDDQEPDVRARACHAMGSLGDPATGEELIRSLGDPAWPVRAMAAKALGRIRSEEAISALCEALRDREWWVRANAAEALRRMGPRGIDSLRRMLDDEDNYARHQAVLMLQESGVLDEEVSHLTDADDPRRASARAFVDRLVRVGQLDRLRELERSHPDEQVRSALAEILPPETPREATA